MSDVADFHQQVVVITGGASGMGAACAELFAARGATVCIVDRNRELAVSVASGLNLPDPLIGDVADSNFCTASVEGVFAKYGRLDVLVNCAGVIARHGAVETTDADWARVMGVNVNGVFYMSRAAVKFMREQRRGSIVNFGSIWGSVGAVGVLAYCASKGAVHQLTRAMALDHADEGIRINAVCPGEVNTPMLVAERAQPPSDKDLQDLAEATIPMRRLADPKEIARVVVFLASSDASYMTGALVNVDAGFTAR